MGTSVRGALGATIHRPMIASARVTLAKAVASRQHTPNDTTQ